ncbi:hypothetical protein E6B08_00550 [Pseudomonas putida]|uniref:DUF3757 domain-containing protein n=1 Tax=Pseudomonas putida TaxID=303 RepID=A0A4D6X5J0_PSEPU|nr:hypothetical protein [Pseudomonas putida]QCI10011.1 hypothetical protein E6B08_00550 [Pseudomonas putida]
MRYLAGFTLAALISNGAFAATCPDVEEITQKAGTVHETEGGTDIILEGYHYEAKNADGEWTGFTPDAEEVDLAAFKPAKSSPDATPPICRYEDGGDGGISLSLKP